MFQTAKSKLVTSDDVEETYLQNSRKKTLIIITLAVLTAIAAVCSLFITQLSTLTPSEVIAVLISHLTGEPVTNIAFEIAIWEYNVPRMLLGLIVGSTLAIGGALMQCILRNPLATPYTTGVSAGASMGAAMFIFLDFAIISTGGYLSTIAINAMVFAMIPTAAILLVSNLKHITPTTMILAGVAMMYVFNAASTLLMLLAAPDDVQQSYEWNIGALGRASWDNIWYVLAGTIPCMIILTLMSRQIHMMNAGGRSALTMGVNVKMVRNVTLLVIAVMTAITVSITGGIGFIGLVSSHVARIIVGSNMKHLLPCSALLGALILLVADGVSRIIVMGGVPVGVLTAVVGGPVFIAILIKSAKKAWF